MSAPAKVAIVTGAARGIGLAVARKFFDQGYRVALLDRDAPARLLHPPAALPPLAGRVIEKTPSMTAYSS